VDCYKWHPLWPLGLNHITNFISNSFKVEDFFKSTHVEARSPPPRAEWCHVAWVGAAGRWLSTTPPNLQLPLPALTEECWLQSHRGGWPWLMPLIPMPFYSLPLRNRKQCRQLSPPTQTQSAMQSESHFLFKVEPNTNGLHKPQSMQMRFA